MNRQALPKALLSVALVVAAVGGFSAVEYFQNESNTIKIDRARITIENDLPVLRFRASHRSRRTVMATVEVEISSRSAQGAEGDAGPLLWGSPTLVMIPPGPPLDYHEVLHPIPSLRTNMPAPEELNVDIRVKSWDKIEP